MFTFKELNTIDANYFSIIVASGFMVVLQSKNTKHYWIIRLQEFPKFKTITVEHKHKSHYEYHIQPYWKPKSLNSAITLIKSHDDYFLNKKKKKHY